MWGVKENRVDSSCLFEEIMNTLGDKGVGMCVVIAVYLFLWIGAAAFTIRKRNPTFIKVS